MSYTQQVYMNCSNMVTVNLCTCSKSVTKNHIMCNILWWMLLTSNNTCVSFSFSQWVTTRWNKPALKSSGDVTSPRWESPKGPLVSVLAMITFTPGRIYDNRQTATCQITTTAWEKNNSFVVWCHSYMWGCSECLHDAVPFQTPSAASCVVTLSLPGEPWRRCKQKGQNEFRVNSQHL